MGACAEGQNTAHQKKNLDAQERIAMGRNFNIPLDDEALANAELYAPEPDEPINRSTCINAELQWAVTSLADRSIALFCKRLI